VAATYRTILTERGMQIIAEAGAEQRTVELSHMAVGDGNGHQVTPKPSQRSLYRERYRATVNELKVSDDDPTLFVAELVVPADIGGFTIREVGIYTDEGELFAIANVPDAYKPNVTEGAYGDTVVRMVLRVANASVVTVNVDPNVAVATRTWVANNVTAGSLIPGGLATQILAKRSNANGDVEWVDPTAGWTVIVFSREETQTLAESQTVVDLANITADGAAVYIDGKRLRADGFSQTGDAQITLAQSYPAGTEITVVQNEEAGQTDALMRARNLGDLPDKAAARANLGLPNWIPTVEIAWAQLTNVPAQAARWPTWGEVADKPEAFMPAAHEQDWATITSKPETATRWPAWSEVTNKPAVFTPADHLHSASDIASGTLDDARLPSEMSGKTFLQGCTIKGNLGLGSQAIYLYEQSNDGSLGVRVGPSGGPHGWFSFYADGRFAAQNNGAAFGGTVYASGGFQYGSSIRLKNVEGPSPYGLAEVERIETVVGHYKPEYNSDGRRRVFFVAEQLAEVIPEVVVEDGAEFGDERVPAVLVDQLMPVAFAAIRELAAEVRALRAEVEAVRGQGAA